MDFTKSLLPEHDEMFAVDHCEEFSDNEKVQAREAALKTRRQETIERCYYTLQRKKGPSLLDRLLAEQDIEVKRKERVVLSIVSKEESGERHDDEAVAA